MNNKPRVLFLNRSYWPDSEATGQLLTALCEGLADDFDVHVLAGQPNATQQTDADWQQQTVRNGVTIHRVQHSQFPKRSMLLKALNFVSFVLACRRKILTLPRPDIVVFETDPFLLPFVADRLQRKTRCRMVGYLQDIYPDVAVALRKVRNSWLIRRLRKRLFDIYARCDRMVVLSTDMKQLLLDGGISEDRIRIIPNWADTEAIKPIPHDENPFRKRHDLQDRFVVMYSGNLGLTQRLEDFIEAAALLQDQPEIVFLLIGRGARKDDLQRKVAELGLTNVRFLDYQPLEQLAESLSAADLHLIPLTAELSRCLMPSKLYGILAAGRPYLTNAPETSELYQITTEHDCGLVVPARSPAAIADAVSGACDKTPTLQQKGTAARRLAESQYTKLKAIQSFSNLLSEVA
ncbi:MAG: glycosyltransferase family 4 protein [Fuerstiella sp.]